MTPGTDGSGLRLAHLVGLGTVAALVPVNSTMIAVGLPDISHDLDVGSGTTGLLITVYLGVMLIGQPIAGRLSDRFGRQRSLLVGLVGFASCSVAAAFAGSFVVLVVARAAQAGFAAVFVPASESLVRSLAAASRRGREIGIIQSMVGGGAAAGPVIGGLVVAAVGWQGVFLVNLPLVVAAVVLVRGLPGDQPARAVGTIAAAGPRFLFTRGAFVAAFVVRAALTFGQYSLVLLVPMVLDDRGWSAAGIGLALATLTVGTVLLGPTGGRLGDDRGRRLPVVVGATLGTVGAVLAVPGVDDRLALLFVGMALSGVGMGIGMPSTVTSALESVPASLAGSASGIFAMSRYVGSIPASLVLAALVTDDGGGGQAMLAIAAAVTGSSILAARRLPAEPGDVDEAAGPGGRGEGADQGTR